MQVKMKMITKNIMVPTMLLLAIVSASAKPRLNAPPAAEGNEIVLQGQTLQVKVGQSAISPEDLQIKLLSVDGDSRCPADVNCIWAGNAAVTVELSKAGAKPATVALNTQVEPREQTYLDYTIKLNSLNPYPKGNTAINQNDYVATFEIISQTPPAPKAYSEPVGLPLELRWTTHQTTYALDFSGQAEAEYTARIKPPETDDKTKLRTPKLPPAPEVDLELDLLNTGKEPIQIWTSGDATRLDLDLQGDGAISADAQLMFTMEFRIPKAITLEPGQSWTMPIKELSYGMRGVEKRAYWTKPGNYSLVATFSTGLSPAPEGAQKAGDNKKFGQVKFVSAPVQLSVVNKGDDIKYIRGGWQNLFSKEKWYQDQLGDEQTFSGVLQAIPQKGTATTLMRDSFYKLGDRVIYTGVKKHPILDELIGQKVEIKGKAVEMELEGKALKEIWPAQIYPGF